MATDLTLSAMSPAPLFKVNEQLSIVLPGLSPAQIEGVEASMLREGRCLESLAVWKETGHLLDGHHRWRIIQQHPHVRYEVVYVSCKNLNDAIKWILDHHSNRRTWRSRFEQVEHYIRLFGEEFQAARQAKMKSGKRNPLDKSPQGQTWYDDIANLCRGPDRISGKTVQRVEDALRRYRHTCNIEDEYQDERRQLADEVLEDLRSGVRKPNKRRREQVALVSMLLADRVQPEMVKVQQFKTATGASQATYYRIAKTVAAAQGDAVGPMRAEKLRNDSGQDPAGAHAAEAMGRG